MPWNLFFRPQEYVSEGVGVTATSRLEATKQSVRKAGFLKKLQKSCRQTSGNPWHVSTRRSGQDSSIGTMEEILLHAKQIAVFSLYLLKLTISSVKAYRSTLNHSFTLDGTHLASNSIISRKFCSFEKSCPPKEIKPLERNPPLVLMTLLICHMSP